MSEKKSILITGSDGFIGSHLYSHFSREYTDVLGTVYYSEPFSKSQISVDLTDPKTIDRIPDRHFDCCIHAAGTVDQSISKKQMYELNGKGTERLVKRLSKTGCGHFIHLSSIAVYGKRVVGMDRDERTKRKPRGIATIPYGRAKARAEQFIEHSNIPYTILRLPPVLGEKDTALTPSIVRCLEEGEPFTCSLNGNKVSILHVQSLPVYIHRLLQLGPQNDAFNIASHHIRWMRLLNLYVDAWQKDRPREPLKIQKKWKYAFLFHFRDKEYLLNAMFSAFGSHFPTDKLEQLISLDSNMECSEGIRQALSACVD